MPSEIPAGSARAGAGSSRGQLEALATSYGVPKGHYDELRQDDRRLRRHWRTFADHAGRLTEADLGRRQSQVARQIHENGVTYNVYASGDAASRPWGLDVLPLVLPAGEWEPLARGLCQRARLLDAVAADLYGPQTLLGEGLLPPALVHGHPGFLRQCHGVEVPGGVRVHLAAFDLARGPDGRWWVVGTRTQAPSGAGYALENRLTVSRLFPDAFRDLRVHKLAPFFRTLQETLVASAPDDGERPHVVLLTPGPYSETYFEHAYLARYLGFSLVEGGDLTVRDDRVFLKTLAGLRPVHAILRRLDDDYCDPLELRADSALGVPGLLQAWRSGRVLIANAPGTSVLESPALGGFLMPLCERLLGETLQLHSVASWWCGEEAALDDALARFGDMVIKPAVQDTRMEPVFAADLDRIGRARWYSRIRAAPERYVMQEYLPLSQAPIWQGGRLESRGLMLRVFVVADGRGGYKVMPGGLARIAGADRNVVSGQRGGGSKDTWVLSDGPVESFSMLPGRLRPADIARSEPAVSSRAGESLFWLGRYAERAENAARMLRATLSRLPDADSYGEAVLAPFVAMCARHGLLRGEHAGLEAAPHELENELIAAMFDRRGACSLAYNLEQTLRTAGSVRERLSADNWRLINHLFQSVALDAQQGGLAEALELVDGAIVSLVAVGGLEVEHMTRDDGWRFLSIGRCIERLLYVVTTAAELVAAGQAAQPGALDWLLDLSDSVITYRSRYMRAPEWLPVADLLLFDRRNPRSAAFQLVKLATQVRRLPGADLAEALHDIDRACSACESAKAGEGDLFEPSGSLDGFLEFCGKTASRLSDALTLRYFSHVYESTRTTATT